MLVDGVCVCGGGSDHSIWNEITAVRNASTGGLMNYDYAKLTKEDLVRHCEAYSESLHELADTCMKLQWRLQLIEKNRRMFDYVHA